VGNKLFLALCVNISKTVRDSPKLLSTRTQHSSVLRTQTRFIKVVVEYDGKICELRLCNEWRLYDKFPWLAQFIYVRPIISRLIYKLGCVIFVFLILWYGSMGAVPNVDVCRPTANHTSAISYTALVTYRYNHHAINKLSHTNRFLRDTENSY